MAFLNNGYTDSVMYSGGYTDGNGYGSGQKLQIPYPQLGLYYGVSPAVDGTMANRLSGVYLLNITDNSGIKIADGQPIVGNYLKFNEEYLDIINNAGLPFVDTGVMQNVEIATLANRYGSQTFINLDINGNVLEIYIYDQPLTEEQSQTILERCLIPTLDELRDINGNILTDINGNILYAI